MEPTIVYKLVIADIDGRLWSWTGGTLDHFGLSVEYKVGSVVYPAIGKLFAFRSKLIGESYAQSNAHLYKAEALADNRAIFKVPKLYVGFHGLDSEYSIHAQRQRIEMFWKNRTSVPSRFKNGTLDGTVLCDWIRLLERVA